MKNAIVLQALSRLAVSSGGTLVPSKTLVVLVTNRDNRPTLWVRRSFFFLFSYDHFVNCLTLTSSENRHTANTMGIFSKDKEKDSSDGSPRRDSTEVAEGMLTSNADQLQRHLNNRQIQLIAIGGSIGTALFVSIGTGLYHGGAGSLLIAYTVQSCVLAMVNNSIAEMSTAFPVSGGFIRLAGKWVDDALGFMVGWNFL